MQNNSITLVQMDNEYRISHRIIAEKIGIKDSSVYELIRKYKSDLLEFGVLPFEMVAVSEDKLKENPDSKPTKIYYLNEQQATLLITYFRNNEKVRIFKKNLVKQFFQMRELLQSKPQISAELVKLEERNVVIRISKEMFFNFQDVFAEIGITRSEELAITSNRAVKKETEVDFIKLAGKEGISTVTDYKTVTDLCEHIRNSDNFSDEIKLSVSTKKNDKPQPRNLNLILESFGYQIKDEDKIWRATSKGKSFSDFVQNKSKYSEKTVFHTVWKIEILKEIF